MQICHYCNFISCIDGIYFHGPLSEHYTAKAGILRTPSISEHQLRFRQQQVVTNRAEMKFNRAPTEGEIKVEPFSSEHLLQSLLDTWGSTNKMHSIYPNTSISLCNPTWGTRTQALLSSRLREVLALRLTDEETIKTERSLCYQHALFTQPHFDGDEWGWERRQASTNASGEDRTAGIFTCTLTVNYPRQHRKRHVEVLLAQPAGETPSVEEAGTWPSCDWLTAKGANVCCFLEGSELSFALEGKLNEILRRMTLPRLLLAKAKMKAHLSQTDNSQEPCPGHAEDSSASSEIETPLHHAF